MRRLILIDHSLKRFDGHHFDYARHTLAAARQLGWTTILASHRQLIQQPRELAADVHSPCFRAGTYSRFVLARSSQWTLMDGNAKSERGLSSRPWLDPWKLRMFLNGRNGHITRFADDCQRLFRHIGHQEEDQVFLPTVSELDVLGLCRYLATARGPAKDWHVQFHHDLVENDDNDERAQQACVGSIQRHLTEALRQVQRSRDRIHFYTTTEPLQKQYQQLDIGPIHVLAYPINPALRSIPGADRSPGPFRIVCPGGPRREKGHETLRRIAEGLQPEIRDGAVCFLVQTQRVHRWGSRLAALLGRRSKTPSTVPAHGWCDLPHPLSSTDYIELIRSADIGLLMYDQRRYVARRAGVLSEFLAAGVPVVVPTASWLADQIADANAELARGAMAEMTSVPINAGGHSSGRRPAGTVLPDRTLRRPASAVGLAVDSPQDAIAAIREIIRHYEHYRRTAEQFSLGWLQRHDPVVVIQQLEATAAKELT